MVIVRCKTVSAYLLLRGLLEFTKRSSMAEILCSPQYCRSGIGLVFLSKTRSMPQLLPNLFLSDRLNFADIPLLRSYTKMKIGAQHKYFHRGKSPGMICLQRYYSKVSLRVPTTINPHNVS